jgi:phosphate transport system substrate-binding protein
MGGRLQKRRPVPIGSGGGIKQIKAKTVTFGATDPPLSGKDLVTAARPSFPW